MGLAWIDLVPGADAGSALAAFRDRMSRLPELAPGFVLQSGATAVQLADGGHRIESMSGGNYSQLADVVVELAEGTGLVSHAFSAVADPSAHLEIGIIGGPSAHWRDALRLDWPDGSK